MTGSEELKLVLRFDREQASASQVAASLMAQVDVADFSISEPDLSGIVKQIYAGGLAEQPEEVPA